MELVLTKLVLSVLHVLDSSACLAVVLTVVLRTNCLEYKKLTLFPNTTKLCDWVFRVCHKNVSQCVLTYVWSSTPNMTGDRYFCLYTGNLSPGIGYVNA